MISASSVKIISHLIIIIFKYFTMTLFIMQSIQKISKPKLQSFFCVLNNSSHPFDNTPAPLLLWARPAFLLIQNLYENYQKLIYSALMLFYVSSCSPLLSAHDHLHFTNKESCIVFSLNIKVCGLKWQTKHAYFRKITYLSPNIMY